MKILICDKISESAISLLKENNIDFDYQPEISPEELLKAIPIYQALVVRSRTKVTRDIVLAGKNLKVIGRVGTGVDNIDVVTAKPRKILVVNAPDANSQAVAEMTIGFILSLLRKIPQAVSSMKNGLWLKKELSGTELSGKTVGIVGYGHIGKKIESLAQAFGMHPLIFSRSSKTATLEELFAKSDIITLHISLTPETKKLVNENLLSLMKPTAYIINTSRGEIIDEEALYNVLKDKKIAGAALDIYALEPLPIDSKWRKLDNVILTPHIGGATKEALERASKTVVEDMIKVIQGKRPENQVFS
jgi:D-3-phosphoglycerate dehydrogenase